MDKGTWTPKPWTGYGLRVTQEDVDTHLIRVGSTVVCAMPVDLFVYQEQTVNDYMAINVKKSMHRYATSMVTQCEISNIPMKPDAKVMARESHKRALIERRDSMDTFYCEKIIDDNIGSNRGLMRILREHMISTGQKDLTSNKYSCFNVDIDIFARMIKVHTHQIFFGLNVILFILFKSIFLYDTNIIEIVHNT